MHVTAYFSMSLPPSLPCKAFETTAGLFNVVVYFICGGCSDFSFVLKQSFPIVIQRSQLSLITLQHMQGQLYFYFFFFLEWEGFFAKDTFWNTLYCGSEDKMVIEI